MPIPEGHLRQDAQLPPQTAPSTPEGKMGTLRTFPAPRDVHNPGQGRRLQLRDNSRRIIGYIERDGTVTNTSRQRIGTLD